MGTPFLTSTRNKLRNKVKKIGRNRSKRPVKSFNEDQLKEEAFSHGDRETRAVPVSQIVGSVGRYNDFDSKFRPKQHIPPDRLKSIMKAMRKGKSLPPVKLYQIKDEYYVLDGNHRISAAKAFGYSDINAHVVEFVPSKNTLENILYREKSDFMGQTGLPSPIELTEIGQYDFLLQQVASHRGWLEKKKKAPVSMADAASDWFKTIYRPLAGIIEKGRLIESFPARTPADLYAYVSFHQWEKGRTRKYGIGIDRLIPNNMEDFRKKMSKIKSYEYPEMQREITAFILIDVKAKHENRIMEKLFSLKEVRELHSVHGNVDILLKFALTRDILTSDAEIISQFVHEKVRTLPGVTSTQTLIPGTSKVKKK